MGTVAWPTLLTLRVGGGVAGWSGLFCIRPTEAVNGSTLPVWESKEEGAGDEGAATMQLAIDRVSRFGLSAATLAWLVLW
ncbi:hypothetical protein PG994_009853 [Apiospora phragmitis]|uniref:Uncharacterized protein n=1 Tax=Apiospora phragmitis TaxID=2905665 RepID=A0ABR1TQZ6_9PEZI